MNWILITVLASLGYAISAGLGYAWHYRYGRDEGLRVLFTGFVGLVPPFILGLWVGALLTDGERRSVKGRLGSR